MSERDQCAEECPVALAEKLVDALDEARRAVRAHHLLQGRVDIGDLCECPGLPDEIGIPREVVAQSGFAQVQ
jgi:hypothetical protein